MRLYLENRKLLSPWFPIILASMFTRSIGQSLMINNVIRYMEKFPVENSPGKYLSVLLISLPFWFLFVVVPLFSMDFVPLIPRELSGLSSDLLSPSWRPWQSGPLVQTKDASCGNGCTKDGPQPHPSGWVTTWSWTHALMATTTGKTFFNSFPASRSFHPLRECIS